MPKKFVIHAESDFVEEVVQQALSQAQAIVQANSPQLPTNPNNTVPEIVNGTIQRLKDGICAPLTEGQKANILLSHVFSGKHSGAVFSSIGEINIKVRDEDDQIVNSEIYDSIKFGSFDLLPGGWVIAEFSGGVGLFCLEDSLEYCSIKEVRTLTFAEKTFMDEFPEDYDPTKDDDSNEVEYSEGEQITASILDLDAETKSVAILYISKEDGNRVIAAGECWRTFKELNNTDEK